MITAAQTDAQKAHCRALLGSAPYFACFMQTEAALNPAASLHLVDDEAVLLVCGENAVLYGSVQDAPQLESFLAFMGICSIKTNGLVPAGMAATPLCLATCTATLPAQLPQGFTLETQPTFTTLCGLTFLKEGLDGQDYAADICTRRNHGAGACYVLLQDGAPVSCATMLAIGAEECYLGDVATLPAMRGHGAAGFLVRRLCRDFGQNGRPVRLLCSKALLPFYARHGFAQTGTVTQCNFT